MSTQADLLSLNRTSLYDKPVGPSEEELRLRRRIDEIYTERPVSGSRYITAILSREGWDRNLIEYGAVCGMWAFQTCVLART